ncbi:hypothetical protein BDZ89DRAFT_1140084 [Hymenopellis radicata]|nr:hypothetical protein BDZ89DRAFT_1140084 [Hymenopellis radicata]
MPFHALMEILPRDASHIGLDEARREFVAYKRDGTLYGRYPATATTGLTKRASQCVVEDAKNWDAIEQYANDNWGDGSRKLKTNPEDYLSQPAQFCVTDKVVELSFAGTDMPNSHYIH